MKTQAVPHEWTYVQFNYAVWIECSCGYRPESQEAMDQHDKENAR